jgi:hypothetical protein
MLPSTLFRAANPHKTSTSTQPKCKYPNCQNPAYVELRTKIRHDYCGRVHVEPSLGRRLPPPHGICSACRFPECNNNIDNDDEVGYVLCSNSNSIEAMFRSLWEGNGRPTVRNRRCSYPGCERTCTSDYISQQSNPTTFSSRFCSRTHAIMINVQECPICLERFLYYDDLNILANSCGHKFHKLCLKSWLNNNKNTCPMCRQLIDRTVIRSSSYN